MERRRIVPDRDGFRVELGFKHASPTIEEAMASPESFGRPIPRRADDGLTEIGQGEWEGRLASEIEGGGRPTG